MTLPPLRGALAGLLATAPMSAVLLLGERAGGPFRQPPAAVVRAAGARAGRPPRGLAADVATTVAHLGFGAALGAVHAVLPRRGPGAVRGAALALAVWGASYGGWVPALGALPPAPRDRRDRQRSLVAAHLVYGAVLGSVEERMRAAR